MNQKFLDFMHEFAGCRIAVAVSGGVDSVTLLHWLHELGMDITALHVNHGLRPNAGIEAAYVRDVCSALHVPCHIFTWDGDKPPTGIEAAARAARYKLMTDFCVRAGIGYLFVAHQADDQIETFLLNLARGSGVRGLAGMRAVTMRDGIQIVRPLLDVPRNELVRYCDTHNIKYFHDEMNDDPRYARVRMRQHRHVLRDMLGVSDDRILLAMRNLRRVADSADRAVDDAIASVMNDGVAQFSDSFLFDLGPDIRLQFIAALIMQIGGGDYPPRLKSLQGALRNLSSDCKFTLGRCVIRRLGTRIIIAREGARTSFRKKREHRHAKEEK
ncbi:tRNA lysidine(34) synthetase TilS [bacterium]|nr:tRNA lysidine(34) synthetase TilS [bacterium]